MGLQLWSANHTAYRGVNVDLRGRASRQKRKARADPQPGLEKWCFHDRGGLGQHLPAALSSALQVGEGVWAAGALPAMGVQMASESGVCPNDIAFWKPVADTR